MAIRARCCSLQGFGMLLIPSGTSPCLFLYDLQVLQHHVEPSLQDDGKCSSRKQENVTDLSLSGGTCAMQLGLAWVLLLCQRYKLLKHHQQVTPGAGGLWSGALGWGRAGLVVWERSGQ